MAIQNRSKADTRTKMRKGTRNVWGMSSKNECLLPVPIVCEQNISSTVSSLNKVWYQSARNKFGVYPKTLPYTKTVTIGDFPVAMLSSSSPSTYCGANTAVLQEPRIHQCPQSFSSYYESIVNDAKMDLLDKAGDQKSMIAVSVLEAGKSLEMILLRAQQIARAIKRLKRGDIKGVLRNLGQSPKNYSRHRPINREDLAGSWLEYRYGWMPLLMDVRGIAQQLGDDLLGQDRTDYVNVQSVRVIENLTRKSSSSVAGAWCSSTQPYPAFSTRDVIEQKEMYKIWARFKLTNPGAKSLSEWGVLNPLQTVWELVPLSFVASWFCSIGDYINHLTVFTGLTLDDAGEGRSLYVKQFRYEKSSWTGDSIVASSHTSHESYVRTPITSIAGLKPDYLRLKFTDYWKHWLDGMALLNGLTRKR